MINENVIAYYKAIIEMSKQVDSRSKNFIMPISKGEEYKHMCFQLAQGYEIDWVSFPFIIINEFGENEHIDNFNCRHPNFAEDIENIKSLLNNLK